MKKKILILFKYSWDWNKFIINKLSKFYEVEHLYINDIKNKNFLEIVDEINDFIETKKIEAVFFDVDYFKFINLYFVRKIKNVKKILMTFDDYELHEINSITANACDLVLSHCPLSVLKYREKGYQAYHMLLEGDGEIFKNYQEKKEIDVLFFGGLNSDRKELLNYIKDNNISVKIVGKESENFLSDEELSKLISKSKIVLNLSKSTWGRIRNYSAEITYKFYYQFKGRIIIAGLCGTACVSEFFPSSKLLFSEDELPTFYTKEECLEILSKLLNNKDQLDKYTKKLNLKVCELYEDRKNFKPIYDVIENLQTNKVDLIQIPYWYKRICAKMIILKNIKNQNLIKVFTNFAHIFPIIKTARIDLKFLIIIESIINIFWYSFTAFFKSKN